MKEQILHNALILRGMIEDGDLAYINKFGLCHLLYHCPNGVKPQGAWWHVRELFPMWPEFSGDDVYPVPGGGDAYDAASDADKLFEGEYGAARIRLLQFIIDTLTKELT